MKAVAAAALLKAAHPVCSSVNTPSPLFESHSSAVTAADAERVLSLLACVKTQPSRLRRHLSPDLFLIICFLSSLPVSITFLLPAPVS